MHERDQYDLMDAPELRARIREALAKVATAEAEVERLRAALETVEASISSLVAAYPESHRRADWDHVRAGIHSALAAQEEVGRG